MLVVDQQMRQLLHEIHMRLSYMKAYLIDKELHSALRASNQHFEAMDTPEAVIGRRARAWLTGDQTGIALKNGLSGNALSLQLKTHFIDFFEDTKSEPFYGNVFVTNRFGVSMCQTGATSGYSHAEASWWQPVVANSIYIDADSAGQNTGGDVLRFAIRIDDSQGRFLGVIHATTPLSWIIRMTEANVRFYDSSRILLMSRDGRLLYAPRSCELSLDLPGNAALQRFMAEPQGFFHYRPSRATPKLVSFIHSPSGGGLYLNPDWILALVTDEIEVLAPSAALQNKILTVSIFAVALTLSVALFLSFKIARPLIDLTRAADQVASGDLERQVGHKSGDETGRLAEAFNQMVTSLNQTYSRLRQEIAEHKLTEAELVSKNLELQRSNQELEQFAYVASHDLQEPLRKVGSYMELVATRYRDQIDVDAREFIDYAVDGARRMKQMINDLLVFSRVGTQGKPLVPTNLNDVMGTVLLDLELLIQESGARVISGDLPSIACDADQMGMLLRNLISNAIKYRGDDAPVIHIAAEHQSTDTWEFSVQDNGIGIDPRFQDRIFNIFQRLHGREQYEGTGIGLAVCKKIVERHQGVIGVRPAPGGGSTFFFTIPGNLGVK